MAPPAHIAHLRVDVNVDLRRPSTSTLISLLCLLSVILLPVTAAMTSPQKLALREEARSMFRHGWENYMAHAFPEDEIKPITCTPHHRDREDPKNIGRNDAMGDFSLTAVDTLSSLAVMAASSDDDAERFWGTVEEVKRIYWYNEPKECDEATEQCDEKTSSWGRFQNRSRESRGFDIDAKVQIFETTIRALGGLLSAHQFATGLLPSLPPHIRPAHPYANELLHLAEDLGSRLLPALTESPTGLPYPRINLRYGLANKSKNPKYYKYPRQAPHPHPTPWAPQGEHESEKHWVLPRSAARESPSEEITETCTAGAGSLVLEFTALSRLTGDPRYEKAAKRAFEAVWERRSQLGLFGGGVDAETGLWNSPIAGIGAGMDSFFEYAQKAFVLFSRGSEKGEDRWFWRVWEESSAAVAAHMKQDIPADWWGNVHLATGANIMGASAWIDSLSAFWPGLLVGGGQVEEAIRSNLFYTALWSRFSALPERWNVRTGTVEGGLGWYPGRPEFVESTYLLYRATKDPWYLHVGEMVMRDLKRRCWSKCGWAGLQDVRTGEKQDRMESFWLGETWSYLFLLFDEDHPLHKGDDPWVFTTEGHPLIFPKSSPSANKPATSKPATGKSSASVALGTKPTPLPTSPPPICENPRRHPPSFFSSTASRPDTFHAASFTRLHHLPRTSPPILSPLEPTDLDIFAENAYFWSPTNSTYYPWTLPPHLIDPDAACEKLPGRESLELIFSSGSSGSAGGSESAAVVKRVPGGIMLTGSIRGTRMTLVREEGGLRVTAVGGTALGRGEIVYLEPGIVVKGEDKGGSFKVLVEEEVVDVVVEVEVEGEVVEEEFGVGGVEETTGGGGGVDKGTLGDLLARLGLDMRVSDLLALVGGEEGTTPDKPNPPTPLQQNKHKTIPAVIGIGTGVVPPPDQPFASGSSGKLAYSRIYVSSRTGCVPDPQMAEPEVVVVKRGDCMFADKVAALPDGVKLLVVVDEAVGGPGEVGMVKPLVDGPERGVAVVVVGGLGVEVEGLGMGLKEWEGVKGVGVRWRWAAWVGGDLVGNLVVL